MSDTIAMINLVLRIATPAVMLISVVLCFLSLSFGRRDEHALIALDDEDNNIRYPVLFWENTLGRSRNSDIRVPDATVSRDHAVLLRREEGWFITDTDSKSGVFVNGEKTQGRHPVFVGDRIKVGMTTLTLRRADDPTEANQRLKVSPPKQRNTVSCSLILTIITILIGILSAEGLLCSGSFSALPHAVIFCVLMWLFYTISVRLFQRRSFELEALALMLSGTGIMLNAFHDQKQAYMQLIALVLGIMVYCFMLWFMEIPDRVMKWR